MPATTRGYRYPLTTDPPNGPAQIQTLAEDIETDITKLAKTLAELAQNLAGVTPATTDLNITNTYLATTGAKISRIWKLCTVSVPIRAAQTVAIPALTNTAIGTIGTGFRPATQTVAPIQCSNNGLGYLTIGTDGAVSFYCTQALAVGAGGFLCQLHATWTTP